MKPLVLVGAAAALLLSAGCSLTPERAPLPADWGPGAVTLHEVQGLGGWARLWDKPLEIGEYSVTRYRASALGNAPGETEFTIGSGSGNGVVIGTRRVNRTADYAFRLAAQGTELAAIRCWEDKASEDFSAGYGDRHRQEVTVGGNLSFVATLHCRARGFHPDWPRWQLDLRTDTPRPMLGVARYDDESWFVAGLERGPGAAEPETIGYRIDRERSAGMLVDRLNGGRVITYGGLEARTRMAAMATAAALLLARDPLAPPE